MVSRTNITKLDRNVTSIEHPSYSQTSLIWHSCLVEVIYPTKSTFNARVNAALLFIQPHQSKNP